MNPKTVTAQAATALLLQVARRMAVPLAAGLGGYVLAYYSELHRAFCTVVL